MARIHDPIVVSQGSPFPTLGAFIGTHVNDDVFDSINRSGHKNFFGSELDLLRNDFFNKYVAPANRMAIELSKTVNALINPDRIRILESIEDFRSIPMSMEMPILLFPPIRQAVEEGRMWGFGYDPSTLPTEDVYGRLIDNFSCDNVELAMDDKGYYPIEATFWSDDPELSDDELTAIERTREYIMKNILSKTKRDPTDIDSEIS